MTQVFLVDRNIEISNLIWGGFYEIELLELGCLETFQFLNPV